MPPILKLETWKSRRSKTFVIFMVQTLTIGIEHTMIQCSLLPYLKDGIQTKYPSFFYGLTSAASFIFPILFDIVVGRCFLKCKTVRNWSIFVNLIFIIGCVIYALPYSPLFPVLGRLLQGVTFTTKSLIYSEVSRVYSPDDVRKRMLCLFLGNAVGEMAGPLLMKAFEKVDFNLFGLHVMYGNIPSLFLIVTALIKLPLIYCFVHDLSYEFYHKIQARDEPVEYSRASYLPLIFSDEHDNLTDDAYSCSCFEVLKENAGVNALLILAFNFQVGFWDILFLYAVPFIIQSNGFSYFATDLVFVAISVGIGVVTLILYQKKLSAASLYYTSYASLPSISLAYVILMFVSSSDSNAVRYVLLALYISCYSVYFPTNRTFTTVTFAKLFRPEHQLIAENLRMLIYRTACMIAAFVSGYFYFSFSVLFPWYIATVACYLFALIISRSNLIDAKT